MVTGRSSSWNDLVIASTKIWSTGTVYLKQVISPCKQCHPPKLGCVWQLALTRVHWRHPCIGTSQEYSHNHQLLPELLEYVHAQRRTCDPVAIYMEKQPMFGVCVCVCVRARMLHYLWSITGLLFIIIFTTVSICLWPVFKQSLQHQSTIVHYGKNIKFFS